MSMYSAIILLPTGSTSAQALAQIGDACDFKSKPTAGGFTLTGRISSSLEKDELKAEILSYAPEAKQIILAKTK